MADLLISKGDKGYVLTFTVTNSAGTARDLTDYTVTLKAWRKGMASVPKFTGTCSKTDPTNGICTYTITATDFDKAEDLFFELELTKTGVIESTQIYTIHVEDSPY